VLQRDGMILERRRPVRLRRMARVSRLREQTEIREPQPLDDRGSCPDFRGGAPASLHVERDLLAETAALVLAAGAMGLLSAMFGWKAAGLYLMTGLAIAIVSGFILGRMKLERFVEPWVYDSMGTDEPATSKRLGFSDRVEKGLDAVRDIVGKVWPWVLAGIAVGAGIHGYVPNGLLASFMGKSAWWSVPAAVVVGVPMYSSASAMIPVVEALLGKGAALGTVLAFMMAVIGLSFPEMVILRKVLRPPLIAAFVGVVATGILLVGWLFNAVL